VDQVHNALMTATRGTRPRQVEVAVVGLAACVVVAAAWAHVTRAPRVTSYPATSDLATLLWSAAAAGLVLAGLWTLAHGVTRFGSLCLLLGAAWAAPVLVGWEAGPPAVRALAWIAAAFTVPLLIHLAVAAQGAPSTGLRSVVLAGYVVVGGLGMLAGLVYNPILDRHSWANMSDFAFVAAGADTAHAMWEWSQVSLVLVAMTAGIVVLFRAAQGRTWRGVPIWGPALVGLAGEAGYAALLLRHPLEQFTSEAGAALFTVRAVALCGVAAGVGAHADARRRLRRRMTALVSELGERPAAGTFEASLRSALRDDGVEVRYWMRERGLYVDASGRPVPDPGQDGRATARIVRGDDPVALVTYDADRVGDTMLEQQLGAAAQLAIDSERLRAEALAHLRELTDSRSRVVAAADQQRQLLERDLHDGAQQRLLAVLFELRLARNDAVAAGDEKLARRLESAIEASAAALSELREFAHGVFPAVLDESGLTQALWSLADRARVPVDLDIQLGGEPAAATAERTAYLVAKAALEAGVHELTLAVHRRDGRIVLTASGLGHVDELHLSDRVGAVGGELRHDEGRLEAVIPCG
jgi:signal transduction histidine kinase